MLAKFRKDLSQVSDVILKFCKRFTSLCLTLTSLFGFCFSASALDTPAISIDIEQTQPLRDTASVLTPMENSAQTTMPSYRATPGVFGSITSVGSDTLATLMALWAEEFQQFYPHVKFQIQATGSATAAQALTQGTASIGPMSRQLNSAEIERFTQIHGYPPTAIVVAIDAIGIYVEKNNPLERLTISQVDGIFSSTRFCGGTKTLRSWSDLGVTKFGNYVQFQLFGRNSASGTYDLFKKLALCDGDYSNRLNEMPSSSSVIQSIASSLGGIGYAALGQSSRNVKAIEIGNGKGQFFAPTTSAIEQGDYPFVRYLYIIVNKPPRQPLPRLEGAFLRYILSEQGQAVVESTNYYTVTGRLLSRQKRLVSN